MNRRSALILVPLAAVPAHSAPSSGQTFVLPPPTVERARTLNFRIVEDPVFAPNSVHNSGMIAQTSITSNTTIGVGLLKASPRKAGSGEFRAERGTAGSRKAAVRFTLKF